jgi:hypothetical protein
VSGAVVHLVWAPLGDGPQERFLSSYRRFAAGAEHRLVLVFKEFREAGALDAARSRWAGVEHVEILMPDPCLDLAAYPRVAEQVDATWFMFLNSNSELLDDGWLAKPLTHLPRGLVGATGSYEGSASGLAARLLRRRALVPFPNPHVRTNAFLLEREVARELDWGDAASKDLAWQVESGPNGLTRQVAERGLETLVVGRDGEAYPPERWREANVFRTDSQANLLVADNRTRQYDEATGRWRRKLERLAWGTATS